MMLESIELLRLSAQRMRYLTERQSVITRNIANADTPGYRSQDLAPFTVPNSTLVSNMHDGAGSAPPLSMTHTNSGHFGFGLTGNVLGQLDKKAPSYEEKLDKNNVSLEEQMVKQNDVSNAFDLATTAYKQSVTLLKASIGASG